ncbi:hypothetical protein [Synechococcus sp. ROS8604]|uniref:hypothetical protein n=1 Tax=Synechococcus sp. ROS8604 TaxID=1442557 RepID=UPI00164425C0|nr:hypothetical protein [Synechococcus sp. ROS8604]QNI89783.1 hypothetical protein SynROS8604_03172 [Synechococcus sp. ROS8604]
MSSGLDGFSLMARRREPQCTATDLESSIRPYPATMHQCLHHLEVGALPQTGDGLGDVFAV